MHGPGCLVQTRGVHGHVASLQETWHAWRRNEWLIGVEHDEMDDDDEVTHEHDEMDDDDEVTRERMTR